MKIIYTESAKIELDRFHHDRQEQLESVIKQEKYVFGDDVVEITASDIRAAEKKFYVLEGHANRFSSTNLLLKVYFVVGVGMIIVGLFYGQVKELLQGDPIQKILVLSGIGLSIVSFFGNYYIRAKRQVLEYHERRFKDYDENIHNKEK